VLILFAIMLTKQIGEDPKLTTPTSGSGGRGAGRGDGGHARVHAVMAPWKLTRSRATSR